MTQLLSGLEMQAILNQQSVREAEVGLGRGENTSSLQNCHFGIAVQLYNISILHRCIVEICFITTDSFYKNKLSLNTLESVPPELILKS